MLPKYCKTLDLPKSYSCTLTSLLFLSVVQLKNPATLNKGSPGCLYRRIGGAIGVFYSLSRLGKATLGCSKETVARVYINMNFRPMPEGCGNCWPLEVLQRRAHQQLPKMLTIQQRETLYQITSQVKANIAQLSEQGLAEKFFGWPRYSHGLWLNVFYFST